MTGETPAVHEALAVYAPGTTETERVPEGYKLTEVGVILEDWEAGPLREDITLHSGHHVLAQHYNTRGVGIPYLTGPADFPNGQIQQTKFTDKPTTLCGKNDILVTVKGSGSGTLIQADAQYCISRQLMAVRVNHWDSSFLYYSLLQNATRIKAASTGLIPGLSRSDILDQEIPVPPLREQRAIAAVLSDVDDLISALDELISKKRAVKTAAMQQLLTGKQRLLGFSGEWEVKRFSEVASPRRDRVDSRKSGSHTFCIELEHIEPVTGRLLGSTNTGDQSSLKAVFQPGDVLFGKLRSYLRKYWLADRLGVCSTEFWVLSANHRLITPEFLFQLVSMNQFIEAASTAYGTHMPRADWSIVKNYEVPLPSLEEQAAIAAVLSDMDAEIEALEARREKTRQVKRGMMQELLTGRTRLV
jgi:type I restriction enzyme S subunit